MILRIKCYLLILSVIPILIHTEQIRGSTEFPDKKVLALSLKSFARHLVKIANKPDEKIPSSFRKNIVKHPKLIDYLLNNKNIEDWSDIFELADLPFRINGDQNSQNIGYLAPVFSQMLLVNGYGVDQDLASLNAWRSLSEPEQEAALMMIPDHLIIDLIKNIRQQIEDIDFSQDTSLEMLKDNNILEVSGTPEAFKNLLFLLVDEYFNKFSFTERSEILNDILCLPIKASQEQKLSVFLNTSGPVVQKFFQMLGNRIKSKQLREKINKLKEHIKPFSHKYAIKTLEKSYRMPLDAIFSEFKKEPIAAATIAQVHLAKMHQNDQYVAVKIRRPKITLKAQNELKILRSITKDAGILNIIDRLEQIIHEELNLKKEAAYIKEGQFYNKPKKGLVAVNTFEKFPPKENVIIMDFAQGGNMYQFNDATELVNKSIGLKNLYKLWLKHALFGPGFFHADLHSGNLLYAKNQSKLGFQFTLIDFGSIGTLSVEERKSLIKIGLGIYTGHTQLIMEGFRKFEQMNCQEAWSFYQLLEGVLSSDRAIEEKTNLIINEAIKRKFDISKNFLQFFRGKAFLEEHINANNTALENAGFEQKIRSPNNIYVKVLLSKMPNSLKNYVFKNKNHEKKNIFDKLTFKFIWHYVALTYLNKKVHIKPYNVCNRRKF